MHEPRPITSVTGATRQPSQQRPSRKPQCLERAPTITIITRRCSRYAKRKHVAVAPKLTTEELQPRSLNDIQTYRRRFLQTAVSPGRKNGLSLVVVECRAPRDANARAGRATAASVSLRRRGKHQGRMAGVQALGAKARPRRHVPQAVFRRSTTAMRSQRRCCDRSEPAEDSQAMLAVPAPECMPRIESAHACRRALAERCDADPHLRHHSTLGL